MCSLDWKRNGRRCVLERRISPPHFSCASFSFSSSGSGGKKEMPRRWQLVSSSGKECVCHLTLPQTQTCVFLKWLCSLKSPSSPPVLSINQSPHQRSVILVNYCSPHCSAVQGQGTRERPTVVAAAVTSYFLGAGTLPSGDISRLCATSSEGTWAGGVCRWWSILGNWDSEEIKMGMEKGMHVLN